MTQRGVGVNRPWRDVIDVKPIDWPDWETRFNMGYTVTETMPEQVRQDHIRIPSESSGRMVSLGISGKNFRQNFGDATCRFCNEQFAKPTRRSTYCSSLNCKKEADKLYQRRRPDRKASPPSKRNCALCGKNYLPTSKHNIYCTINCKKRAKVIQQRGYRKLGK